MYGRDDVIRRILHYHHPPLIPKHSVVAAVLPCRYVAGGLPLPLVLAAMFGRLEVLQTLVEYTRARASSLPAMADAVTANSGGAVGVGSGVVGGVGVMTSGISRSSFNNFPAGNSFGSISFSSKSVGGGGGGYRSASPSFASGAAVDEFLDVFDQVDHAGYTLLHHAAVHGQLNVAQYLLGLVSVGQSSLHGDKGQGQGLGLDKFVDVQGKAACDKNKKNQHGRTPLILSVDYMRPKSHISMHKTLSEPSLNMLSMKAADKGRLDVFKALVFQAKAYLEERDSSGHTPLMVAANHGLIEVVELLKAIPKGGSEEKAIFLACLHDHNFPNQQTGTRLDPVLDPSPTIIKYACSPLP